MHLNTPVNGEEIKTHFTYHLWKYVLLTVAAVVVWCFLGDIKPRISEDKKIELYVMSATTSSEIIDSFLEPLWKETAPDMESVCAYMIPMLDDYYTDQFITTRLFAGEGDIYILNEKYFKQFASQGCLIPLDGLVADGTIDPGDAALQNGYVTRVVKDSNDQVESSELRLYGIPLNSFGGFAKKIGLNNQDLYAGIVVFNQNDENVIPFFNAFLQEGKE